MIVCSSCGKQMDKMPTWLESVSATFVCNNCPNRQTKNIAFVNLDQSLPAAAKLEEPISLDEVVEEKEEEEA